MAIVVRYKPVSMTAEQYDATSEKLEAAGVPWPPEGLDHHICFGSEGNLNVSEIWDSREQWEAFGEKMMPVLAENGIQFSGDPDVFEVHDATRR